MRILLNMKVFRLCGSSDLHVKFSQLYTLEAFSEVWKLLLCTQRLSAAVQRAGVWQARSGCPAGSMQQGGNRLCKSFDLAAVLSIFSLSQTCLTFCMQVL